MWRLPFGPLSSGRAWRAGLKRFSFEFSVSAARHLVRAILHAGRSQKSNSAGVSGLRRPSARSLAGNAQDEEGCFSHNVGMHTGVSSRTLSLCPLNSFVPSRLLRLQRIVRASKPQWEKVHVFRLLSSSSRKGKTCDLQKKLKGRSWKEGCDRCYPNTDYAFVYLKSTFCIVACVAQI